MRAGTTSRSRAPAWRRLGWLALVAFTLKGLATMSLILWGFFSALP